MEDKSEMWHVQVTLESLTRSLPWTSELKAGIGVGEDRSVGRTSQHLLSLEKRFIFIL